MTASGGHGFRPRRVLAVDLATGGLEYPDPEHRPDHPDARVLVRWGRHPVGLVDVAASDADVVAAVRNEAGRTLGTQLSAVMDAAPEDGAGGDPRVPLPRAVPASSVPGASLVTVAIASFRNVESTVDCVRRVLRNSWTPVEVVVVDNDTDPDPLARALDEAFADDRRVRRVHEPRQGLSFARNAGLSAARGDIVAFTDDDVRVDYQWVERLVAGFSAAGSVACVTGSILPAELETQPQLWLEEFGGFHRGFRREIYNSTNHRRETPLYPFAAGMFGSGANMAFRTSLLRDMGGFAVDLGTGTPAQGGEDLDIFQRIISAGHDLVYEPSALMWHFHRRSLAALRKQMFRYGIGLSATVTKWLLDDAPTARAVLRRVPRGVWYLLTPGSGKNSGKSQSFPRLLTLLELLGVALGPVAYLRSRRRSRTLVAGWAGGPGAGPVASRS